MAAMILGMLAETFVHPGSGSTSGAIDLPVAREGTTGYPYVAGSSLKGALKDSCEKLLGPADARVESWFGKVDGAGAILVSDARLLLLPVRSLSGAYRWITCRHLLERWQRDNKRAGGVGSGFVVKDIGEGQALVAEGATLFLEELDFQVAAGRSAEVTQVASALAPLIAVPAARDRLPRQLAILKDDDFAWFAGHGLPVQARNVLTAEKRSTNLWYEETLPPDTLMYALISERVPGALTSFRSDFRSKQAYLQLGGNETVGQGWFILTEPGNA
jgi:CRISPR-associated protein Cmr4